MVAGTKTSAVGERLHVKQALRSVIPPVLWRGAKKLINPQPASGPPLFGGDNALFKHHVSRARHYAEYGCGQSSIWVATNTSALMTCVDTSRDWIAHVRNAIPPDRATLVWIDCGDIAEWGKPNGYDKHDRFKAYAEAPWRQDTLPDLVLIDGRFRVMCFIVCLQRATEGTLLLFDDYFDRPRYRIVEEVLAPVDACGRQAMFPVPEKESLDQDRMSWMLDKFEFVMD